MYVLQRRLSIKKDEANLLFVGCAPCQYWSVITGRAGSQRKEKSHGSRNLLLHFLRFVNYYRPGFVLIENVIGMNRNAEESGLNKLRKHLKKNDYEISVDEVFEAHKYGVPQTRRRFVLIASRVGRINPPKATGRTAVVRDAIGKMSMIRAGGNPPENDLQHRSPSLSEINIKRLKLTPEGGGRSHWADKDELQIQAYRDKPVTFFRENYGRLAWDKPAPTITTKFFAISSGRFGHPKQDRAISLREGALLQTFPPNYQFETKSFVATAKLIGNAVPPELARRIGKALLRACRYNDLK